MNVRGDYERRYPILLDIADGLASLMSEHLTACERVDRISARAKSVHRFMSKAEKLDDNGSAKYEDPLSQIQDQVGARVTVFYKSDVHAVKQVLMRYFRPVESRDLVPASEWEFGYFGWHAVCFFPSELIKSDWPSLDTPQFFELQVKTLFQHAWSEANHDLGYKPESGDLTSDQKRMLAFASAQAWGADRAFDDLFQELSSRPALQIG